MKAKANEILKNEEKKMSVIKIWRLKNAEGQLSDGPNFFEGQNQNLPV